MQQYSSEKGCTDRENICLALVFMNAFDLRLNCQHLFRGPIIMPDFFKHVDGLLFGIQNLTY
jgi:hypothetical protein